jgi:hypothetical protein
MKWNKDLSIIKDNFLDEAVFKKIQVDLDTVKFENRFAAAQGGHSRKIYFEVSLGEDHPGPVAVRSFFKAEFGIIITDMESFYLLSPKHEKPTPHSDRAKINCLIYLKGGSLMNNGTALYEKDGENWVINSHIGFKENRAVIFRGNRKHSSLQFAEGSTGRFIMSNWINEYELE